MPAALKYGGVAAVAIFFVGEATGMGGSFVPNVVFSLVMGLFAAACFQGAVWFSGRNKE